LNKTSKSLVFLGNHKNNIFIDELMVKLLNLKNCNIKFISTSLAEATEKEVNFYKKNKIDFFYNKSKNKIPKISYFFHLFMIIREIYKGNVIYDVCSIQYVNWRLGFIIKLIRPKFKKIICTFWGSDFYGINSIIQKHFISKIVNNSDLITATNEDVLNLIIKQYKIKNYKTVRFGLAALDYIKSYKNISKKKIKYKLGINSDKIVVTCGTNGSINQQHEKIINCISSIDKNILKKVSFVFPVMYGGSFDYINKLKAMMSGISDSCLFIEDFLDHEKMALLALASDILIQIQRNDQFSGVMQEFIYANNLVITGKWLPYKILTKNGVKMIKIESIESLGFFIERAIGAVESGFFNEKKDVIWDLSSWNSNIVQWVDVFGI